MLNSYDRLSKYFEYIPYDEYDTYEECGETISSLATATNIPLSIVRQDIKALLNFPCPPIYVESDVDEIDDNTQIFASYPMQAQRYSIDFTPEEGTAISKIMNFQSGTPFLSKFIPYPVKGDSRLRSERKELFIILSIVNEAINLKKQIYFEYGEQHAAHTVSPIKIIFDNNENIYNLLCIYRKKYTVFDPSKITESFTPEGARNGNQTYGSNEYVHIMNQNAESYDEGQIYERIPHVWGNDFTSVKGTHVVIRFRETAHSKVVDEVEGRGLTEAVSTIDNGYFTFEDTVYGIDSFYAWVRSFGKEAIILKPESLAKRHIENLKSALAQYD